jgi:hypothetical protein
MAEEVRCMPERPRRLRGPHDQPRRGEESPLGLDVPSEKPPGPARETDEQWKPRRGGSTLGLSGEPRQEQAPQASGLPSGRAALIIAIIAAVMLAALFIASGC